MTNEIASTSHFVTLTDGVEVQVRIARDATTVLASIVGDAEDTYPGTSFSHETNVSDAEVIASHLAWAGAPAVAERRTEVVTVEERKYRVTRTAPGRYVVRVYVAPHIGDLTRRFRSAYWRELKVGSLAAFRAIQAAKAIRSDWKYVPQVAS